MASNASTLLQRLRYWQGQALRSRDLNDQMAFEALLRAWHNRALHLLAYGIREGLEVTLDAAGKAVEVRPGLAYDAGGRELIVHQSQRFLLPQATIPLDGLILILSYRESASSFGRDISEACLPGCAPGDAATSLSWVPAGRFDPQHGVALRLLKPGPQLLPTFSLQRARPLARPRIGGGATLPGNTAWRLWRRESKTIEGSAEEPGAETPGGETIEANGEGGTTESGLVVVRKAPPAKAGATPAPAAHVLGLQVDVDTSAAGFTVVPCYQAWLEGDVWNPDLIDLFAEQYKGTQNSFEKVFWQLADGLVLLQLLELRFGHVYQPTASGFTYRLWFPQLTKWVHSGSLFEYLLLLAHQGRLAVAWVGIQEHGTAEAAP
jgi:hypothetical protein